jgi:hypothetical protein
MIAISSFVGLLALTLAAVPAPGSVVPATPVEPEVTAEQLKASVQRSLPFLTQVTMKDLRARNCISCHRGAVALWSMNAAMRHGLEVDRESVREANNWAERVFTGKAVVYHLQDKSYAHFERIGVPKKDQDLLKKSAKNAFGYPDDLLDALKVALDPKVLAQHQNEILKTATQPNTYNKNTSKWLAYSLILSGLPSVVKNSDEFVRTIANELVKSQDKDGSWEPNEQIYFPHGQYRTFTESRELVTAWNLVALASAGPLSPEAARCRDRARGYLQTASPGATTESLVLRVLMAKALGETEEAEEACADLLRRQLPDGGWGWLKNADKSNPYNTGMALYALARMDHHLKDPCVQRGVRFLLGAQDSKTGVWLMEGELVRKKITDKHINWLWKEWGSGWAVVGMLNVLPD